MRLTNKVELKWGATLKTAIQKQASPCLWNSQDYSYGGKRPDQCFLHSGLCASETQLKSIITEIRNGTALAFNSCHFPTFSLLRCPHLSQTWGHIQTSFWPEVIHNNLLQIETISNSLSGKFDRNARICNTESVAQWRFTILLINYGDQAQHLAAKLPFRYASHSLAKFPSSERKRQNEWKTACNNDWNNCYLHNFSHWKFQLRFAPSIPSYPWMFEHLSQLKFNAAFSNLNL